MKREEGEERIRIKRKYKNLAFSHLRLAFSLITADCPATELAAPTVFASSKQVERVNSLR